MTIEEIETDAATAVNTLRYELYNGMSETVYLDGMFFLRPSKTALFADTLSVSYNALGQMTTVLKEALQAVPSLETFLANMILSITTWVIVSIVPYFLFKSLSLDLDFGSVLYAALLLQLIGLLPFQLLGGLGILDASWAWFLFSQGMPFQQATEFALASRALFYGFVFLWGISGWSLLNVGQVRGKLGQA